MVSVNREVKGAVSFPSSSLRGGFDTQLVLDCTLKTAGSGSRMRTEQILLRWVGANDLYTFIVNL